MALKHIDQDTVYPNGKRGLPGRPAIAIVNENTAETEQRLAALEGGSGGVSDAIEALEQEQAALQSDLAGEAQTRSAMDAALYARIDAEQTARQAADTALGLRIPGKNRLINGNFDVWQRVSPFTASGYTADRWAMAANFMTGPSVFQSAVSLGDANFPRSKYTCGATSTGNTDAANHAFLLRQRVEDVNSLQGQSAVLSLRVFNSGAAGRQIAIEAVQDFGAGGSSPVVAIGVQKHALAVGLNVITHQLDLPPTTGKTRGANSFVDIKLWLSAGTAYNGSTGSLGPQSGQLFLGECQLETGSTATGFEYRPPGHELDLCQRYGEEVVVSTLVGVTFTTNGDTRANIPFKVAKRAAPALTSAGTLGVIAVGNAGYLLNINLGQIGATANRGSIEIVSVSNYAALLGAGNVVTWGSRGNTLTFFADAEL